jgi:hypothetical protein
MTALPTVSSGVLAIATAVAIEFDISWEAEKPWSDIVGDGYK